MYKKAMPFAKLPDKRTLAGIKLAMLDCYGSVAEIWTEKTPPEHHVWRTLSTLMSYRGVNYTPEDLCHAFFAAKDHEKAVGIAKACGEPFDIEERNVFASLLHSDDEFLVQTAAEIFRASSTWKRCRPYPGAIEFLKAARRNGLKTSLASNAQSIFTVPELKATGLAECFDFIGISSSVFYRKPSPKFFQFILDHFGVSPEQALMIGNHDGDDMKTSHAMGIKTCYLNSNQSPEDAEPPSSDIYDLYFDYPNDENAPESAYPFFRLAEFMFGSN
ncbi:MAG: HAD family hydrolase [Synergistaceae bacterium]|nr:HAD family hydrolase [Synergistaceae bacterium]